jgi:hypothetical protein
MRVVELEWMLKKKRQILFYNVKFVKHTLSIQDQMSAKLATIGVCSERGGCSIVCAIERLVKSLSIERTETQ